MAKVKRFGTFGGVFTPSILTLLGVIMYLRLPWITGQVGLIGTLGIIFVAHIVSGCTGLSVASIATDKRVETGGTYYMISRSLGLPIGGTLGWALFAGLSLSVSLYLIGFAEVFMGLIGMEITLDNIRIMGSIILFAVLVLTFISTSLTIKTQYIILTIMVLSLLSVFLGRHGMQPSAPQISAMPQSLPWITLFAIFFPAVTGFEAGVAMSGDLKDARKAIPMGTIMAILVALVIYVALTFFFVYTVDGDKLVNDPNVLFNIALVPQLVMAGVLGATLSSALGSILGAPRILQAVANDRIAPAFLGKGFGASKEPRNALIFTYLIAQAGILIGELNAIARVVTIFFIITYGFLNITYTIESWASSDFRPSFKIPRVVSIIGALACIILMIQLDIMALGIAAVLLVSLFLYLRKKELNLSSGDSRSSVWLSLVKTGLMKLAKSEENTRNWRPNIIVFSGGVRKRPYLTNLAMDLVGKLGIFTNFELVTQPNHSIHEDKEDGKQKGADALIENLPIGSTAETVFEQLDNSKGIITRKHKCNNIYEGIGLISSVYGFSGFEPNTVLMGWPKRPLESQPFTSLMKSLVNQDYSMAFLKYNSANGFKEFKSIDVWWQGEGNSLPLALHLVRFLTSSSRWRNAKVRVLALCANPRLKERYNNVITSMLADFRINGQVKVVGNSENKPLHELMQTECGQSNLVITDMPGLASNTKEVIEMTDTIANTLGNTLFVHADSTFSRITSLTEVQESGQGAELPFELPDFAKLKELDMPEKEPLRSHIVTLVDDLAAASDKFVNTCLENIRVQREQFLDKLLGTIPGKGDKVGFTSSLCEITHDYKSESLGLQIEELHGGVKTYLKETELALKKLPASVLMEFEREHYKRLKPFSLVQRIHKGLKLIRFSALQKSVKVRVKLQPAAYFYIYYNRIRELETFYKNFHQESLEHLNVERELENLLVTKGKSDMVAKAIEKAKRTNNGFVARYENQIPENLKKDIVAYLASIQSPQSNILSRRLGSVFRKSSAILLEFDEFPAVWKADMENQLNRIWMDLVYMNLKERIKVSFFKMNANIKSKTEQGLLKHIDVLDGQAADMDEKGTTRLDASFHLPSVEVCFTTFRNEVEAMVAKLDESVSIAGTDNEVYKVELRKIADYYISNELLNKIGKESFKLATLLGDSLNNLKNLVRLANFTLENEAEDAAEKVDGKEKHQLLVSNIKQGLKNERLKIGKALDSVSKNLEGAVYWAFDPLSSVAIIKKSSAIKKLGKETQRRGITSRIKSFAKSLSHRTREYFANLKYRQSEGLIWAGRLSGQQEANPKGFSAPDKGVLEHLPFYYLNLFTGRSGIGQEFWTGMEHESARGKAAVEKFMYGSRGALIVTGERRSGKSSLSKHIANSHFTSKDTFFVRAPREGCANVALFEKSLYEAIQSVRKTEGLPMEYKGSDSLETLLPGLESKCVVVIHDLELWWERRESGTAVVERLIDLIGLYGRDILFVINANIHSLKLIDSITSLNSWAFDVIECRPFPAKQLKEFIIARHNAGGLRFVMDDKAQEQMSGWDYAKLFNHIFNLSAGNPGYAINLWLGSIKNISGDTLIMEKPVGADGRVVSMLSADDAVIILQFVLHRRFSVPRLASLLMTNENYLAAKVRVMHQEGILTEKYPGVYSLNPMLVPHLVKKLKSLDLV
ncbi:MAG: amino acid permease [Bacteroidales bacterium]|nr:amino acid permease [Bacteroidales bacterium]